MATTLYIRKDGNDSNNGFTEATARASLGGAGALTANANDYIFDLGAGQWNEVMPSFNGNVTVRGQGWDKTIFPGQIEVIPNGYNRFVSWEKCSFYNQELCKGGAAHNATRCLFVNCTFGLGASSFLDAFFCVLESCGSTNRGPQVRIAQNCVLSDFVIPANNLASGRTLQSCYFSFSGTTNVASYLQANTFSRCAFETDQSANVAAGNLHSVAKSAAFLDAANGNYLQLPTSPLLAAGLLGTNIGPFGPGLRFGFSGTNAFGLVGSEVAGTLTNCTVATGTLEPVDDTQDATFVSAVLDLGRVYDLTAGLLDSVNQFVAEVLEKEARVEARFAEASADVATASYQAFGDGQQFTERGRYAQFRFTLLA